MFISRCRISSCVAHIPIRFHSLRFQPTTRKAAFRAAFAASGVRTFSHVLPLRKQQNSRYRPKRTRRPQAKAKNVNVVPSAAGDGHAQATLPPPTAEQQAAINTLLTSPDNLIINACAGSGKTTTILLLAAAAPDETFLVMMYNNRLMTETETRVRDLGLKNVIVLNYHTLGVRFYTSECATDQGLKRIVEDDMTPLVSGDSPFPAPTVLVMDEQQDMTPIMKRFTDKLIRDMGFVDMVKKSHAGRTSLRIVVLGDQRQEIYGFNNADSRFLTLADDPNLFGYVNENPWRRISQPTSNRLTTQNASFISEQLFGSGEGSLGDVIKGARSHNEAGVEFPRPRYVICDPLSQEDNAIVAEVQRLLSPTIGLSPADIIILAPSVRVGYLVKSLANDLVRLRIPVFVSDSDHNDISPRVSHGKVLICTYQQAKGIERTAAIVLGFDASYHEKINKLPTQPTSVTNPQHVAATRAKRHLVLVHDCNFDALPFVDVDMLPHSCEVIGQDLLSPSAKTQRKAISDSSLVETRPRTPRFSATGLCRNNPETLITRCLRLLDFRSITPPAYGGSNATTEVEDVYGLCESVANITGTAVLGFHQYYKGRKPRALDAAFNLQESPKRWTPKRQVMRDMHPHVYRRLRAIEAQQGHGLDVPSDLLFLATNIAAQRSGLIVQPCVIPPDSYTWLSDATAREITFTLNHALRSIERLDTREPPGYRRRRSFMYECMLARNFPQATTGGGPVNPVKHEGALLIGEPDMLCVGPRPVAHGVEEAMSSSTPGIHSRMVIEVKHTQTLQAEHILQTALYMLLAGRLKKDNISGDDVRDDVPASGVLVSAATGQAVLVAPRTETALFEIFQKLVDAKSGGELGRTLNNFSDEEFLREAARDFSGLVGPCALPAWFAARPRESKWALWKDNMR